MDNLDVDSSFANIPLDETIDICIDNLYNGNKNPLTFPSLIFAESFFTFHNKHHIDK